MSDQMQEESQKIVMFLVLGVILFAIFLIMFITASNTGKQLFDQAIEKMDQFFRQLVPHLLLTFKNV
jgi:uncharacterized protein YggT (Ycf19 family)